MQSEFHKPLCLLQFCGEQHWVSVRLSQLCRAGSSSTSAQRRHACQGNLTPSYLNHTTRRKQRADESARSSRRFCAVQPTIEQLKSGEEHGCQEPPSLFVLKQTNDQQSSVPNTDAHSSYAWQGPLQHRCFLLFHTQHAWEHKQHR